MSKRNLILIFGLIALVALVIVGCGGASEEPSGEPEQQTEEQTSEQSEAQPDAEEETEETEEQVAEQQVAEQEEEAAEEAESEDSAGEENGEEQDFSFIASSEKPEGCASCHVKGDDEKDYRLGVEVSHIEGHVAQDADATMDQCMMCHKADGMAPAFEKLLHEVHLTGEENHFVSSYGGACNQCHKMAEGGAMVVKGLEKEGTNFIEIKTANVDLAKDGCASCHEKQDDEHDYRLGVEVNNIEGHPEQDPDATVDQCMMCHKTDGMASPFKELLHLKHYEGGDENHFINYGSSCRNCHSLADDGTIGVKGL